jgi:hypothetical protein
MKTTCMKVASLFIVAGILLSCSSNTTPAQTDHITEMFSTIHISDVTNLYSDKRNNPVSGQFNVSFDNGSPQADLTFQDGMITEGSVWTRDGTLHMSYSMENGMATQTIMGDNARPVIEFLFDGDSVTPTGVHSWHENGTPSIQSNRNMTKMWYDNGQMKMRTKKADGKIDGKVIAWHPNGEIATENEFKRDKPHGTFKSWDEKGNLISKKVYEMGMPAGTHKTWNPGGQLIEKKMYQAGKPHGTHKKWDSDGNLLEKRLFEDGSVVSTQ